MNTPEFITELKENEIFVFGSNLEGHHYGGAAKIAHEKFGAQWGVGLGRTGQCYAIPTLAVAATTSGGTLKQLTLDEIRQAVNLFFTYVKYHPELTFYFTKIGLGIAGFEFDDIARIVMTTSQEMSLRHIPSNVILPVEFENWVKDLK